ncbi:hypothetical protein PAPYR_13368 [Paratrimastix pyriformis]|uniref:C2H2-type domain-containing protein n=1 Tax=Paratrimastix pyriformis TaxID=342808 RepID=A0ABQ8U1V3_9EUKA|nr:hypothetical protein PAPYR_13368 [Paratrimastix pyriformis]
MSASTTTAALAANGSAALMAGQLLTVFVAARDAYGNPIACLMPGEAGAGATPIGAGNLTLLWDGPRPLAPGGASINGGSGGISGGDSSSDSDSGSSLYAAQLQPTQSGAHNVTVAVDGAVLAAGELPLTLLPGLISATQCDTSLQPSEGASLRAGSPCHVSVTARDAFANPVPCGGTSDPAAVFGLLWDGSASLAPSPLVWACNEEFVGTFSPLVAGPHEVALLLLPGRGGHDATLVAASNHTVQVTRSMRGSTAVLPAQAQAGQPAPATMTARDQYDNLIGCIPATAGATFALVASCPLAGPTTWACAEGGTRFVANVTLAQTGTQSLRVGLAVGGDAVGAAGSVDVTPGPLWAGASSFTVVPATVPAGEPLAVRIVGRDRLANRIGCTAPPRAPCSRCYGAGPTHRMGSAGPATRPAGALGPTSWNLRSAPARGPLAGANATVEVTAGTIDPGRSDFVAANQTEAGMPYTVLIHARSPSGYPLACYMANRNAFAVRWDGATDPWMMLSCTSERYWLALLLPLVAGPHALRVTHGSALVGHEGGAAGDFSVVVTPAPDGHPDRDNGNPIGCTAATANATFALLWDGGAAPAGLRWGCSGDSPPLFVARWPPPGTHNLTVVAVAQGRVVTGGAAVGGFRGGASCSSRIDGTQIVRVSTPCCPVGSCPFSEHAVVVHERWHL